MSEQDDATDQRPRDRRRLWLAVGVGVGAAAVAVTVAITAATVAPAGPATAGTTAPTTSSSAAQTTTTSAAPVRKSPAPETTPTVDADPEALADLRSVAAGLTSVVLTSPSAWDRWLPQGKPYPGPSTEEDIATKIDAGEIIGCRAFQQRSFGGES